MNRNSRDYTRWLQKSLQRIEQGITDLTFARSTQPHNPALVAAALMELRDARQLVAVELSQRRAS